MRSDATGHGRRVIRIVGDQRKVRPRRGHGITQIEDPGVVLHEMRLIKDDYELGRMRTAAAITSDAHRLLMRETRPGQREYELQAILENEFRRRGAGAPAYGTIVGGGVNATVLHYVDNRDELREGQLVLVDAGASSVLRRRRDPHLPGRIELHSRTAASTGRARGAAPAIETVRPGPVSSRPTMSRGGFCARAW